ncbi:hypothetical protein TthTF19_17570 [Thermus thermophilus]|uniref:FAD-binding protein n=1 Tax=Thermus thermophilus TaxID=274 RepID=UPI00324DCA4C
MDKLEALKRLFPGKVDLSESERRRHGKDEGYPEARPVLAVVYPEGVEDVQKALQWARAWGVAVIPYGAGTSLEGHLYPTREAISLDLSRMNRVLEVRPQDFSCVVEPGLTRKALNEALKGTGLFFPVDPGADASLGGMAATNASGTTTVRYGGMRQNVLALQVVLASGEVLYPFLLYSSSMTVADHLTLNELWRRVKKAKDPIEKHRFLAVYHAKRGLTAKEIAKITLSSIRWVQETVRRYNREGPEGLRDKRHQNPGQKPKLTPEEQRRVLEALQGPPPDGGLWTGPKLRDWVERELGKKLSLYPIYRLLHEMGFALRVPRPRHAKADGEAQEAFKKTSPPRSRRRGPRGGR